jgi:hypothetical protein
MKQGNTIIGLFAAVSLGALTLWAIKDLWVVLLVLVCIAGVSSIHHPLTGCGCGLFHFRPVTQIKPNNELCITSLVYSSD